jgi:tetratricopeptide (TPR) repeat protein
MSLGVSGFLRTPAGVVALAIASFLAWRCITLGMADLLTPSDPAAATYWRAAHPAAQYEVAQADFLAHRDDAAIVHARLSIASNPLDGRAYRIAAALAERVGDQARARELFELAERRAPRDLTTRIKLATYALKAGDHERAMHEVDMLLRMQPELDPDVLPRLVRLTEDPSAFDPIVRTLSRHPAWRNGFLALLATNARDPFAADRMFARLASEQPLSTNETDSRRNLRHRIDDRQQVGIPAARAAVVTDWYALMDWKTIDDTAWTLSEDAYDSVGTP